MKGEKVTIYDDKLVFKSKGKIFTLRGDVLKMISDYDYITTNSANGSKVVNFVVEMHFDIHSRRKSLRERNIIAHSFKKRHSCDCVKNHFFLENP